MMPWHGADGRMRGLLLVVERLRSRLAERLRMQVLQEEMSLFMDDAEDSPCS